MSLSDAERQVLDLITAWQKDYPDQFGPTLPQIDHMLEQASFEEWPWASASGVLLSMKEKGLLETQVNKTDWRKAQHWRATSLLIRLAHEASP